jgi:hypothetical protein
MKKSIKTILSLILLCLLPLATNAQSNMEGDANADLNKDGIVDERDVEELAKLILTSLVYPEREKGSREIIIVVPSITCSRAFYHLFQGLE